MSNEALSALVEGAFKVVRRLAVLTADSRLTRGVGHLS